MTQLSKNLITEAEIQKHTNFLFYLLKTLGDNDNWDPDRRAPQPLVFHKKSFMTIVLK